jgi:hypothetical protein
VKVSGSRVAVVAALHEAAGVGSESPLGVRYRRSTG